VVGIQAPPLSEILSIKRWNSNSNGFSIKYIGFEQKLYDGSLDKLNVPSLPLIQRLKIIYQIALGAQHYRNKNFVHNDLKPANILYSWKENDIIADIGDFGGAWKKIGNLISYTPPYVTQNDLLGLEFSLSESGRLWSGKKLDIYSLGITFCQLLAQNSQDIGSILIERKHQKFLGVLKRMQQECDGYITDHVCCALGLKWGRPEIEEVIESLQESLE